MSQARMKSSLEGNVKVFLNRFNEELVGQGNVFFNEAALALIEELYFPIIFLFCLQDYSRSQQRDRVHYLLETGYPVLPVMTTPLARPAETDDHPAYENMEGVLPMHGLAPYANPQ